MKKFICLFISIMVLISVFSINAIAISQSDAIKWLESQEGAEYKNQYGAQCVCFVTAYMNWCVTGNPNSGKYPTYNAVRYPEIAGSDPANWEVIKNYLEFIPQPGDIFVSKGLDSKYGHVGVVLSSDINNAKIIDQNGVNASDYGSPAAIHNITWTGAYSPTYYIRYKGFSKSSTISSVSFSHDTSSNVINSTDARVYTWLYKKPGQKVTDAGIYIYPSGKLPSPLPTYQESFAANDNFSTRDKVHINYTIGSGKEVNYKLSEGTKYSYVVFCVVDGKNYTTSVGTFTTKGNSVSTPSESNVSFSLDTSSNVINSTDARVYTWLYKKPGQKVTDAGIYIYPSGKLPSPLPTYQESFAANDNFSTRDKVHINYTIGSGKEVNYKLSEGTKYSYVVFCIVDGKEYVTSVGSFTTKGQAPHTHSYTQAGVLDAHPHYTYYKCSCGNTSVDNSQTNFEKSCALCLESVTPNANKFILTIGEKTAQVWGNIKTNDVAPKLVNGRTMLPARFVAENLGAKVEWDASAQMVTISTNNTDIMIFVGSSKAYVNGKKYTLDSSAFVENGRTYTPVRFIAEALGANVDWNQTNQQVIITK